jgi:hypothetical protein
MSGTRPPAAPRLRRGTTASGQLRIPQPRTPYDGPLRPAGRQRFALALPLVVGGVALLVLLGVGAAVLAAHTTRTSHQIRTPPSAGGLLRDVTQESVMAERLAASERQFRAQFRGRVDSFGAAVYRNATAVRGGPAGPVVFLGAAIDTSGDPGDFVDAFRTSARSSGYLVRTVAAGPGAQGVCGESAGAPTICAWATGDSVGELLPAVAGWDAPHLATLMRAMRPDLEQSKN